MHEDECIICTEELNDKYEIIYLDCKHYYHENCINQWIKKNNFKKSFLCPYCQQVHIIKTKKEFKQFKQFNNEINYNCFIIIPFSNIDINFSFIKKVEYN
jgi:predicted RNA-binding Zn-ribbon protein involved in translation (DUF1610 family)